MLGSRVVDHPGEHDVPQGRVGLAVPTAVEADGAAACRSEASRGETPQSLAKVDSDFRRSGLSPAATKMAEATSVPTPSMALSSGAVSATRVFSSPVDLLDLFFEGEGSSGQGAQGELGHRPSTSVLSGVADRRWPG